FVFFLLEIKVVSYGLLSLAGVGSLVLGSLLLFRSADPALQVSLSAIIAISLVALALVAVSTWVLARDRARQVATGVEGMVGDRGIVRQDLAPRGKVFLRGELWDAVAEDAATIPRDREVEVVDVEGLLLRVRA